VIPKHSRGWNAAGLLRYLMGPGRSNEHTEQRVVAAWTGDPEQLQPQVKDPASLVSDKACGFDVRALATRLTAVAHYAEVSMTRPEPDARGKVPAGPVWHCSLRNHERDRVLTDAEWAEVAADVMDRTGIAPRDDPGGCRWVAIRHAKDHIHIAAVLVRQDTGRKINPRRDWPATMRACQAAEARYELTSTAPADRTALTKPTRAEVEKAIRRLEKSNDTERSAETARTWLCRMVRAAAVASGDLESFRAQLEDRGVLMELRGHEGRRAGVVFGMPGDTACTGQVWFSGSKLAPDLTLPTLRARWAGTPGEVPVRLGVAERVPRAEQDAAALTALEAIEEATDALHQATTQLRDAGPGMRPDPRVADRMAGIVHAAGDMACAVTEITEGWRYLSRWSEGYVDRRPAEIPAYVVTRATGQPGIGQPRQWDQIAAALRSAARGIAHLRHTGSGAELLLALAALIAEVMAWHEQTRHLAQAHAAREAGKLLTRAPYRPAGYPEQPAAPSRSREDARRPGQSRESPDRQARRENLATLRRRVTEEAMRRRPDSGYTDTELAARLEQAQRRADAARNTVNRLRAELNQIEPQVAAGHGPNARELHTQLAELRECVRLHQAADEQRRHQTQSWAHAQELRARAFELRDRAQAGGLRWPGQRARLYEQATELINQADANSIAGTGYGWEVHRLTKAAAEHGPAQSDHAYTALRDLGSDWPHWSTLAQDKDTRHIAQLRADLNQANTDATNADDTTGRLDAERRYRETQPARRRAAEEEVRQARQQTRNPTASAPSKSPRGRSIPPPLRWPPNPGQSRGRGR
jgi:hypothetical protein